MARIVKNRLKELVAIKERHEGRRISRRVLADESGVSLSSIQGWATNEITRFDAYQIVALCDYFGVGVDELLVVEDEAPTSGQEETLLAIA